MSKASADVDANPFRPSRTLAREQAGVAGLAPAELRRRQSNIALLVDEGERSEAHTVVLQRELLNAENAIFAERVAAAALRREAHVLSEHADTLLTRLEGADRINQEWHERVRTMRGEFELRSLEWSADQKANATKWEKATEGLREQLASSMALLEAAEQRCLALEGVRDKLRASEAEAKKTAQAAEAAEKESGRLRTALAEAEKKSAATVARVATGRGEVEDALSASQAKVGSMYDDHAEQMANVRAEHTKAVRHLEALLAASQAEVGEMRERARRVEEERNGTAEKVYTLYRRPQRTIQRPDPHNPTQNIFAHRLAHTCLTPPRTPPG